MKNQRLWQRQGGEGLRPEKCQGADRGSSGRLVEPFFEHLRARGGLQSPTHCSQTGSLRLSTGASCAYASAGKMRTVFLCKRRFWCAVGAASMPIRGDRRPRRLLARVPTLDVGARASCCVGPRAVYGLRARFRPTIWIAGEVSTDAGMGADRGGWGRRGWRTSNTS
jgi:hypothetical protein